VRRSDHGSTQNDDVQELATDDGRNREVERIFKMKKKGNAFSTYPLREMAA